MKNNFIHLISLSGFKKNFFFHVVTQMVKKIFLQCGRPGFDPWEGKVPWRREWQLTPVFLPEKFHGQRSLAS